MAAARGLEALGATTMCFSDRHLAKSLHLGAAKHKGGPEYGPQLFAAARYFLREEVVTN
jgi:hypothetical protein